MRNTFFSKILFIFTARKKIAKIIQEYNPDIINLHTLFFPNYLLYKYINCKTIITPWNGDIVWHKYSKEYLFIKWSKKISKLVKENQIKKALNSSSLITYNSLIMKKRINELLKIKIPCEYVQLPGVDTRNWTPTKDKNLIRKELKLPIDKFIVLSSRQLGPIYNIDIIIKAAKILTKLDNNIIFMFIFHEDKKWIPRFRNLILESALNDKVLKIGHVDHDRMLQYYQASNVGVSISSKDSCSQSVIEGMSTGLPMIVGNIPAARDLVTDYVNGLLTPTRNEYSMVENILMLKSNSELRYYLSRNARACVIEKYDYYQNMNKMKNIFHSI